MLLGPGSGGFYVKYEILSKLGEGAFGEAVKVRRRKVCGLLASCMLCSSPIGKSLLDCQGRCSVMCIQLDCAIHHGPAMLSAMASSAMERKGKPSSAPAQE